MKDEILLLQKYPKHNKIISIIILLPLIIALFYFQTYDSYNTIALYNCEKTCTIEFSIPYSKNFIIDSNFKIQYNKDEYNVENIYVSEPYLDNTTSYEDVTVTSELKTNNKVINIKLLYNKQRIIKKILNLIKG